MRDTASIMPLALQGLTFAVDGQPLVDRVDLTLRPGGVTVLIGPNGAGKSLLLRLCHGLVTPTAGSLHWQVAEGRRAGVKAHAMVFQKPVMLRRSVRANLLHALAAVGRSRTERNARADEALVRFRLDHLAERPARVLSGGEQQRLAIARAWALDVETLFLDEPTSALDPAATRAIEETIAMMESEGRTIVMATHDLGQARRLGDRVLFVMSGRIHEDTPAEQFFREPTTPEARAFLAGDLLI